MKIDKPVFIVKVVDGDNELTVDESLRTNLRRACITFLRKTEEIHITSETGLIDASRELAIEQRVALNEYATAFKVQHFADKAAINDNITLNEEVNLFLNQFNKSIK